MRRGDRGTRLERGERPPIVRLGPALRTPLALALGCHGNPDRCLRIGGRRMPVCARCIGIVAGNLAALPFFALAGLPGLGLMLVGTGLLLPALLDGGLQATSGYWSTNPRRFVTGIAAGFGQALVVVGFLAMILGYPGV